MCIYTVFATLLPCIVPMPLLAQPPLQLNSAAPTGSAPIGSAMAAFDEDRAATLLAAGKAPASPPSPTLAQSSSAAPPASGAPAAAPAVGAPPASPPAPLSPAAPGAPRVRRAPPPRTGGAPAPRDGSAPAAAPAPAAGAEKPAAEKAAAGAKEARPAWLLPDWGAASFDWNIFPVVGFEAQKDLDSGVAQNTLEFGLQVGLTGVPVVPGNPGLQLAPTVGAAYGLVSVTPREGKTQAGDYVRLWAGNNFIMPLKFYRNVLSLRYGHVKGKLTPVAQSFALADDNAILVLPFFSAHYTYTYTRLFSDSWSQVGLQSNDNWLHTRFFTSVLNAYIDLGPGLTYYRFYDQALTSAPEIATARVTDFRLFLGSDIFWKLAASGSFRYVMSADVSDLAQKSGNVRLPTEPIGAPSTLVVQPYDSLIGSAFFGLKNLIGGLSVGYQYNFNAQHFLGKDGKKTKVDKRQGFGVSYETSF